ncbi:MAG: hypothetical protein NTX12_01575 [Actinobacteria bacterium]|nr:hypothetical protein [Actinomycetota bacterium]
MIAWQLARARILRHRLSFLSLTSSIALALIALFSIQAVSQSTAANLSESALRKLPFGDQTITLSSNRLINSDRSVDEISKYMLQELKGVVSAGITQEVLYHQLSDQHGNSIYFGGVDSLNKKVSLLSGRAPHICTSSRCEVLQIGGDSQTPVVASRLGLTVVGLGKLEDRSVFSGTYSLDKGVPLLLANGVVGSTSNPSLANFQGSNGWVAKININSLQELGTRQVLDSLLTFENNVSTKFSNVSMTWPEDALSSAQNQSLELNQKMGTLTFALVIIFLIFQTIFTSQRRKESREFRDGLGRIGAPKRTIAYAQLIESAASAIAGLLLATVIILIFGPLLAGAKSEMRISPTLVGVANVLSFVLLIIVFNFASQFFGDRGWESLVIYLIVIGLLVLAVFFSLSRIIFGINFTFALAFTTFCYLFALVLCLFLMQILSKKWRNRDRTTYLIAQEGLRTWQGISAIVGISMALATSALGYQSGVEENIQRIVNDKVPLDLTLGIGSALVKPLDLNSIDGYSKLIANSQAFPVLRLGGSVRSQSNTADSITILGVPPAVLDLLANKSLRNLRNTLTPISSSPEDGIPLGNSHKMEITLENIPQVIDVAAWFRTPRNTHVSALSNDHGAKRVISLTSDIPPGSTLVAIEFHETSEYLSRRLHAIGEGKTTVPTIKGEGKIAAISLDSIELYGKKTDWLYNKFAYQFDGGSLFLQPPVHTEMPVVLADPATSALSTDSILTLSAVSQNDFKVRIRAVDATFPTAGDRFVVMDLSTLQNNISQTVPSATDPTEVWVSTAKPEKYFQKMEQGIYSGLQKVNRIDIEREMRVDPATRNLEKTYAIALAFALLLCLLVLIGAPRLFLKERVRVLQYLESQGSAPGEIYRSIRKIIRMGILVGMASGISLGVLVCKNVISSSIPYRNLAICFLSVYLLAEIIVGLLTLRGISASRGGEK